MDNSSVPIEKSDADSDDDLKTMLSLTDSPQLIEPLEDVEVQATGAVESILQQSTWRTPVPEGVESNQVAFDFADPSTSDFTEGCGASTYSLEVSHDWPPDSLNVFVLSEAGKPIYSRYGDESQLSSIMGVMQALVSFVANSGDELNIITTSDKKFMFVVRSHLILVAVGQMMDTSAHLFTSLNYVYSQILSSLTLQRLERMFSRHTNLDLRRLLVGDSRLLSSIICLVENSFGTFLNAFSCTVLPISKRSQITQVINQCVKPQELVFAILLNSCEIVSMVRMKNQQLRPLDIHILTNLVYNSQSFKSAHSNWLPVCMPKFDPNGFLYANITYLDEDICLVLLSVKSTDFYNLQSVKDKIFEALKITNNGDYLRAIASSKAPTVLDTGIANLRHFVYKHVPISQYIVSQWTMPYAIDDSVKSLTNFSDQLSFVELRRHTVITAYRRLHAQLHFACESIKFVYHITSTEVYFAWKSDVFELYATVEPLVSLSEISEIRKQLIKWIETKKTNFFLLSTPTF